MIFKKIFQRKQTINSTPIILNQKQIDEIVKKNRNYLKNADQWLSEESLSKSYFDYGVPDYIRHLLNEDIGSEITYTDLIAYYARFFKKASYLELGVSVGKNFLQICDYLQESEIVGFDIENINSPIEKNLEKISSYHWETKENSIRKEPSTFTKYKYKTNAISYLAGDIWDENSWKELKGKKFNIIFSDALHDPKALLWEYEMIKKYNLLDNEFIIFWDDLNHGLEKSFFTILEDLKKYKKVKNQNVFFGKVNGWLGKNEQKHDVGIISNINLS